MRKKLLICNKDPAFGQMMRLYFNITEYTVWNCTMYPNDVRSHLDKRKYDVVVFFAGDNKYDVAYTTRKLKEKHPETDVIVVMLYKWDQFQDNYYDEGASLCVWLQEITIPLLASFIRLQMFHREHPDVNMYISTFLADHGFTGFHKGFYYLCTALDMCLREPERLKHIIQQVYTETAHICGASDYTSVERAMRYYIDKVLASSAADPLLKMRFPKRPPMKKFISDMCGFYKECNYLGADRLTEV
ncbi:MAG: hypothetical protein IJY29_07050 [Ruminococcus sp.]|nr:hypothetical protein [Ruminococcus sp.]